MADTTEDDRSEEPEVPPTGWLQGNTFDMAPQQIFLSARCQGMAWGTAHFFPLLPSLSPDYQEPASDHPIYNLIGRNAAKMGRFEHELDKIIWKLAGVSPDIGLCVTSAIIGHGNRFHVIIGLMKTHGFKPGLIQRMANLGLIVNDAAEERNRYIHDTWFEESSSKTLHQHRSVSRKEIKKRAKEKMEVGLRPSSMDKLETTIKNIDNHIKSLHALRDEILAEMSTLPDKSQEAPPEKQK